MADLPSSAGFWLAVLMGFVLVELLVTALVVRLSSGSRPDRR
ncbi:MAG TPA: hypothetical protein VMQ50_03625 [Casimicrobiaceae bacterium]|nr:hypothetical protein [Casimicrobiaceae bacterium]